MSGKEYDFLTTEYNETAEKRSKKILRFSLRTLRLCGK